MSTDSFPTFRRVIVPAFQRVRSWLSRNAFPLRLFLVQRLGLLLVMYLSLTLIPAAVIRGWPDYPLNRWTQGWTTWDADWYRGIAENGYVNEPKNGQDQRDTAFFPLYPMLIAAVRPFVGDRSLNAGLLVSNACFLLTLIGLFALFRELTDERTARRALILFCVYPFSFFFGSMYTESLFLAAVVWSFLFAHRGRWALAGVAAACAGATRVVGFLLVPALLVLYAEQIRFEWRRVKPNILGPLLGLLGPLAHMAYLWSRFGDPLLFQKSQYVKGWAGSSGFDYLQQTVKETLAPNSLISGSAPSMNLLHLLSLLMAIVLLAVVARRVPRAYLLWSIAMLITSLSIWKSMGRYVAVVFPVFLGGGLVFKDEGATFQGVVLVSTMLLVLLAITFGHFYWVA